MMNLIVIVLLTASISAAASARPGIESRGLDKNGTTSPSRNSFGSQLLDYQQVTSRAKLLAERTGIFLCEFVSYFAIDNYAL